MAITIDGTGTISGVSVGGLPDGAVTPSDLSTGHPNWDSSGNVGIGTSSPRDVAGYASLAIDDTSGSLLDMNVNGTRTTSLTVINTQTQFGTITNTPLTLWTNNAERMRLDTSGNLLFNSGYGSVATAYGCRAWVNFDGTGTVAIRASGNVSSITDNAVGDYTVNFTNAFVDSNYNFITNSSNTNNSNILCIGQLNWDNPTKTTSALRLYNLKSNNGTLTDQNTISVAVFR